MARNSEKAMAMLNRWYDMKHQVTTGIRGRRPRNPADVDSVKDCEYWRHQVIRDATRKITEIQNAGLGEHRIRDLNDEINRLLRDKIRWEVQIKELGGPDYRAVSSRAVDSMGAEVSASGAPSGYRYFGAAKQLPGVRELFEREASQESKSRSRAEIFKNITPDYYGWRDEEDAELCLAETDAELKMYQEALAAYAGSKPANPLNASS